MKKNELFVKLFNGTISIKEYEQLNKEVYSYITKKFININPNDLEDIISIVNIKLFNNDKFDKSKNIKEITYYTKSLINEVIMFKNKKKTLNTISINYEDDNEMKFESDNSIYDERENDVKDFIEINMPIFYEYLYTKPYQTTDKISYNFLMEKYNLTLFELANLFHRYKNELIYEFNTTDEQKELDILDKINKNKNNTEDKKLKRKIKRDTIKNKLKENAIILDYSSEFNPKNRTEYTILQYDLNMNFIKEWKSHLEAAKVLEINSVKLYEVLNQSRKQINNYIFTYKYKNKQN